VIKLFGVDADTRRAHWLLILSLAITFFAYERIPLFGDGGPFSTLITRQDRPVALLTVLVLMFAFCPSRQDAWIERLLLWLARNPLPVASATGISLAFASYFVYQKWPVTMDEYSPWFQAHVFAGGSLSAHYPAETLNHLFDKRYHANFFAINWNSGYVISNYWPGFALLLTPFAALGVPWLCNPLVVALSIIALHRLVVRLGLTPQQQGWALLFAVSSPAFTLNGMSFYSMPAHLLLNTVFALCLVDPNPRRLFMAGLVGGYALSLHNPLPHLAFALPWLAWVFFSGKVRLRQAGWLVAGYLPFSVLLGLGWVWVMRDLLSSTATAAMVAGPASTPAQSGHTSFLATISGFFSVFSWPTPSILAWRQGGFFKLWLWAVPLLVPLAIIGARQIQSIHGRLIALSGMTVFLIYFFVPFSQGHGWGYRYFHPAWFALPVLAAVAMKDKGLSDAFGSRLALCAIASLSLITPIRAWQMGGFVERHLEQMPVSPHPRAANECEIVFHSRWGYYGIDLVENTPDLKGCRLTFLSRGRAADMAFAKRLAPGGFEAAKDSYGWIYRYPAGNKTN